MSEVAVSGGAPAPADGVVIDPSVVQPGEALPPQVETRPKESVVEPKPEEISTRDAVKLAKEQLKQRDADKQKPVGEQQPKTEERPKVEAKPGEKPDAAADKQPPRERAPDGKFAAKEPLDRVSPEQPKQSVAKAQISDDQRLAPQRFNDAAKKAWEVTPDEVKTEVHRLRTELEGGLQKYRTGAENFAKVERFHKMAEDGGTTLDAALDAYVTTENTLRDPNRRVQGMIELCARLGVHPLQMAADMANAVQGGTAPQQQQHQPAPPQQQLSDEDIDDRIEQRFAQRATIEQVNNFRKDHPGFDQLSDRIVHFLQSEAVPEYLPPEQRLAEAYELAVAEFNELAARINPALAAAAPLTPSRDTKQLLAHTQSEDRPIKPAGTKSISGAPSSGSDPDTPRQASSNREAVRLARKRLGG